MSNQNKLNKDEIELNKLEEQRIPPDITSDKFSEDEQKEIVKIVLQDLEDAKKSMADWIARKAIDQKHINSDKPSEITDIKKYSWMSDVNLGLCEATIDIFNASILATAYNPESIHFKATESNDIANRDLIEKFVKWGLGKNEANFYPEADEFVNNVTGLGAGLFKVYWEVKYEWVDRRIPVRSKETNRLERYNIRTEYRRFEKGVIKNISSLDDIYFLNNCSYIQDLPFIIEIIHLNKYDIKQMVKHKEIIGLSEDKIKNMLSSASHKTNKTDNSQKDEINKAAGSDFSNLSDCNNTVDIAEWYGYYEKDGKLERYRFRVHLESETFLSGKPLRKINRTGKYPYVSCPFKKLPGKITGRSGPQIIEGTINALNNTYNQKSDFQYIQNCKFGFYNSDDPKISGVLDMVPGKLYPTDGDPSKSVYFPNINGSLSWAEYDLQFLVSMIERLTGAASYFMTNETKKATATRDMIISEKGDTNFGLKVKRIIDAFSEAITMWFNLYQEWAPPRLAERILDEDGKQIFKNLSIDDLKGKYDVYMVPDIISGSKAFERQLRLWGLRELQKESVWLNPQYNPKGNYLITKEAMQSMGYTDVKRYLGKEPEDINGESNESKNEFYKFIQGDKFDPPEGVTPKVVEHYFSHKEQKEKRYNELPEEYRPNFDDHWFKTQVNYMTFMKQVQQETMVNSMAANVISDRNMVTPVSEENINQKPSVLMNALSSPQQQQKEEIPNL